MELEAERLTLFKLQVMDVWLRCNLQLFTVHDFLEGFLNERFDDLLTNRILEALLYHRRRCLARTEARKTNARCVTGRRLVLGVANGLDGHTNFNQSLEAVGFLWRDLDVHARIS